MGLIYILIFFKILQGENVQISNSQYCDLCLLSEIFQVNLLQQWLHKYIDQHSDDIDFIIDLIHQLNVFNVNLQDDSKKTILYYSCIQKKTTAVQ